MTWKEIHFNRTYLSYSGGPNQANLNLDNRLPGQKTPTSSANPHMNNFSIPSSPHTTGAPTLSGKYTKIINDLIIV